MIERCSLHPSKRRAGERELRPRAMRLIQGSSSGEPAQNGTKRAQDLPDTMPEADKAKCQALIAEAVRPHTKKIL
jgi:hypothetical protein